jgi:hypothetical protein
MSRFCIMPPPCRTEPEQTRKEPTSEPRGVSLNYEMFPGVVLTGISHPLLPHRAGLAPLPLVGVLLLKRARRRRWTHLWLSLACPRDVNLRR